jgi:hypothetical protein
MTLQNSSDDLDYNPQKDGELSYLVAIEAKRLRGDTHWPEPIQSDGGSTSYYQLPEGATELNDLIEHKRMSFALGNIFKAVYRYGEKDAASKLYDLNKIIYFAERLKRQLEIDNA